MKIFDSHCHLNDRAFAKDLDEVILRAARDGVVSMMVVGITEKTSKQAIEIAEKYPGCFASVGIHPHDAKSCSWEALKRLTALAENNGTVRAWGETGLDFNRMYSPRDIQEKWFAAQMEAAKNTGLPLIFHERDSGGRFFEIIKELLDPGYPGVVHCFSGNRQELEKYLDFGFYIGITGIVTLAERGSQLRELVSYIPENRILVETDAPYLTPSPRRNRFRRNEPAFVADILARVTQVKKGPEQEFAQIVWENTCRLFSVDSF